MHTVNDALINWLLAGDPSIVWQTMRDLQGLPESSWLPVRQSVATLGWGATILGALQKDGLWPDEDWRSSLWSLLLLVELGLMPSEPRSRRAAELFLKPKFDDPDLWEEVQLFKRTALFKNTDLCHVGLWLRIGVYFNVEPKSLVRLSEILLDLQMADGGWNCRSQRLPKTRHSSFHTTFNALEGLKLAANNGIIDKETFRKSEARALEFMLIHHLYRSDRTGEVIDDHFARLSYPTYYHYRVLRALDYFRSCPEILDSRLEDPMTLILSKRLPNGRWPIENPISGKVLVKMESARGDSRWNTLKAMRVIKALKQSTMP